MVRGAQSGSSCGFVFRIVAVIGRDSLLQQYVCCVWLLCRSDVFVDHDEFVEVS